MVNPMLEKLNPIMDKLSKWVEDQIPGIQAKLSEWAGLFGDWIKKEAAPKLLSAAWDLWIDLLTWLADRSEGLWEAGKNMMAGLLLGIGRAILDLPQTLGKFGEDIGYWLADQATRLAHLGGDLGRAIIDGFGRAIQDGIGWIGDQARNMAQAAINEAKRILGIGSPSKVFMELGGWTGQGMAIGLQQGTPMVQSAMASMVAPPAYPQMGGSVVNNVDRSVNFAPSYGQAVTPNPQRDSAMARTFALG
jgi:hypothetical protein